jgi:hypothetical protein
LRGQLRDLRREYQPQAARILSGADGQITALLRPAQQTRYERMKESNRPVWRALRQQP